MVKKKISKLSSKSSSKLSPKLNIKDKIKIKVMKKKTSKISNNSNKTIQPDMLEESFKLVKKLNSQVSSVEEIKNKLQRDIKSMGERLTKHERNKSIKINSNLIFSLKEELINEIEPLLGKIHMKSLRVDAFKEIEKIIDVEFQKLKSEVIYNSTANQKNATKRFAEVEIRLIENLKSQKNLQNKIRALDESFLELRNITQENLKEDAIDLSTFEAQINRLVKDNQSLHSLLEKYEDELYSRTQIEEIEIEKKVQKTLQEATKKLLEVKSEQNLEETFIVNKINEVISYIERFESKVKISQISHKKNIDKKISERFDNLKKTFTEKLTFAFKDKFSKTNLFLKESIDKFNDEKMNIEKNLELFKTEISSLVKNYVLQIDTELKKIHTKEETYVLEKEEILKKIDIKIEKVLGGIKKENISEREFLRSKLNEIVEVFNGLSLEQKKSFNNIEKNNKKVLLKSFNEEILKTQEKVAEQLIKNNHYLNEISTSSKENERKLREDIEQKFLDVKGQYEKEFTKHLESFDIELKGKESEFVSKLIVVTNEKDQMLGELNLFKQDITSLTKKYISKYDDELSKINIAEANFEGDKIKFSKEIETLIEAKKTEIKEYSSSLEVNVNTLLEIQKGKFERNEDTFRDVFKEKIENLHEYIKHRLDNLDKKFIEKNVKSIRNRIDTDLKEVLTLAATVQSKEDEINKKLDIADSKEEQMFANLNSEKDELNKKIETRLMELEQQLNKRFLDIDTDFSTFKGTVIDEVEALMKEVNDLIQNKVEVVDKLATKLNFIGQEAKERSIDSTQESPELNSGYNIELSQLREEINNIKATQIQNDPQIRSMNQLIIQMSDYESQLISLVESLVSREINSESIIDILVQKGHPKFYVSMIVESLNKVKSQQ